MKKRNIILLFWSLGFLFIIVGFFNFSWRIPNIDSDIEDITFNRENIVKNIEYAQDNDNVCFLSWKILAVLEEMGLDETDINYLNIKEESMGCMRITLMNYEIIRTNQLPTLEFEKNLLKLSVQELQNKKIEYVENASGPSQYKNLTEEKNIKTRKKQKILKGSIFFQILGLLLTQIGLSLQLKWRL